MPRDGRWRWWCGNRRRGYGAPPAVAESLPRWRGSGAGGRPPAARATGSRRAGGRRRASGEALADQVVEPVTHGAVPHAVEDLGPKAVHEDAAGGVGREPATAEIIELGLVDRTHGGAVGALHVVRIDLELRLAVGASFGREQQVVVGLLRIGALRPRPHDDAPGEHAVRPPG